MFFSLCSQLEIYISEGTHSTEEDSECLFLFLLVLLRSSKQRVFPESRTKHGLNVQISSVLTLALWAPLPPKCRRFLQILAVYYEFCLIFRSLNWSQLEFRKRNDKLKFVSPVNKQINDKERVAAAMENPNLREIVEQCVTEPDD